MLMFKHPVVGLIALLAPAFALAQSPAGEQRLSEEVQLALVRLMKELDHHRDLHGARGVECVIGMVGPLRFTAQKAKENSNIGGRGKDASFDLTFGAGQ